MPAAAFDEISTPAISFKASPLTGDLILKDLLNCRKAVQQPFQPRSDFKSTMLWGAFLKVAANPSKYCLVCTSKMLDKSDCTM